MTKKGATRRHPADVIAQAGRQFQAAGAAQQRGLKTRSLCPPSSINEEINWSGDTSRYMLDICIEAAIFKGLQTSFYPPTTNPAYLKAYCWWAIFDHLRNHECLLDSQGVGIPDNVMPRFPDHFMIPRPLAKLLEYMIPYVSPSGVTAKKTFHLPTDNKLPEFTAGVNGQLNRTFSIDNIDYLKSAGVLTPVKPATASRWECVFDPTVNASNTWATLFGTIGADIADWFASNNGVAYSHVSSAVRAPDASFHAIPIMATSNGTFRQCVVSSFSSFNPEVAVLLNGVDTGADMSIYPQAFVKPLNTGFINYAAPNNDCTGITAMVHGFLLVCDHASKFFHGKAQYLFKKTPWTGLTSFCVRLQKMNLARWHQILALTIHHGLGAERSNSNDDLINIAFYFQLLYEGCLISRVHSWGGYLNLLDGDSDGNDVSSFMIPGSRYNGIPAPAVIADYLSAIGPNVCSTGGASQLVIPVLDWGDSLVQYTGATTKVLLGGTSNIKGDLKYYLGPYTVSHPLPSGTSLDNATSYTQPFQFSFVNHIDVSEGCFIGSYLNTGRKGKVITMAHMFGDSTWSHANWNPIFFVEMLDIVIDTLFDQGAQSGTDGSTITFLNKQKIDLVTFDLPRPMGGQIVNFAEVLYVTGQAVTYNSTTTTGITDMEANSTAQIVGVGPGATDFWLVLQAALKVDRVGSCAQLDQHQIARCVAFGMYAYPSPKAELRMAALPYVMSVLGGDSIMTLISSASSDTFKTDYLAEKEGGQDSAYAIRGALAPMYTNMVARSRFRDMQPKEFLRNVAFTITHFKTAPYYFQMGKTYAESGSWDWLESVIKFITPVADVIAAPFGLGGVVDAASSGLLALLGTESDGPNAAQPSVKAKKSRRRHTYIKVKKSKKPKKKNKGGGSAGQQQPPRNRRGIEGMGAAMGAMARAMESAGNSSSSHRRAPHNPKRNGTGRHRP